MEKVAGFIQVGVNDNNEVIINLPPDPPHGASHYAFSRKQAMGLATMLQKKASSIPQESTEPTILFKIPTRQRPLVFQECMEGWMRHQTTAQVRYLVSIDEDDSTLSGYREVYARLKEINPAIAVFVGTSPNKIHAVNRDIEHYASDWDIMVNGSDDMACVASGWDAKIIDDMKGNFPSMDGALHYPDGNRTDLITLSIMGRRLYDAFGYIYHPAYQSLWADNEFTDTVKSLRRYAFINTLIFRHRHRSVKGGIANDQLYERNEAVFNADKQVYNLRKDSKADLARVARNLENTTYHIWE